ncbi:TrbG/VirB9 family P-type conjugative transfer protein [Alteraurantiacibacter palmitatis]|uniref:TrbG/VirB9 family P-type conjugative transfer protein n=1 Tax=Alteraurantiacibacter palmitatis TaxID=2054628 RepID=A0ABV7E5K2_9SPHN
MTRAILAAALFASTFGPALALPANAQADPRLVVQTYDETRVIRVPGRVNVQATIRFAEGETIQNVAIGDSQKWQVTPSRSANLLFVKPLDERAVTNMTVLTDRRIYLFDLVASPAHRNPLYVLSFIYPDDTLTQGELAARAEAEAPPPVETANADELAAAMDDFAVLDPASLNFAWAAEGAPALLPETVYDNGRATFLAWPTGAPMPAILVLNEEGVEGPVNFAVRGDVIVIDEVPAQIILRAGDASARLLNRAAPAPARS